MEKDTTVGRELPLSSIVKRKRSADYKEISPKKKIRVSAVEQLLNGIFKVQGKIITQKK